MKTLIFGAKGYMGTQFLQLYPDASASNVDIGDRAAVAQALDAIRPDVVIKAAGKTGRPNVDWCEDHKEETLHSNVLGPLVLQEECAKRGIYWVHVSSGCIYEGDNGGRGFTENDPPNFSGSFYSRSKAWSDQILQEFPVLILRLRMPFDGTRSDRNLLMKLRKYTKVLDAPNSLTYIPDFLEAAKILIGKRKTGIFNIVNQGTMSPYDIMTLYRKIVDPSHHFERLELDGLETVVKAGRSNCLLSIEKLQKEGVNMRTVEEAVSEALQRLRTEK